jgi:hypothetical protein
LELKAGDECETHTSQKRDVWGTPAPTQAKIGLEWATAQLRQAALSGKL